MSLFTKLGNEIASPVDAAGNPRAVENVDMQRWMTEVERATLAFQAGGGIIFPDKATMDGTLTYAANQMAWVMGDTVPANNGIYRKVGASGSGSWVRMGDLPISFIMATNAGVGTPDAIVATSLLPIPAADGAAMISLNIAVGNTGSPVTVSFNGGAPLTIKTMSGNDVAPGGLTAGMIVTGFKAGSTFRMITDQASAAIQAAAEAAQAAAEAAAAAAGGTPPVADRTALKALDTSTKKAALIYGEGGRNGTFIFVPDDLSALVAVDPLEGIYIAPDSDSTGTSGAWVRQAGWMVEGIDPRWFGAIFDNATDDTAAIQAALNLAPALGGKVVIPGRCVISSALVIDRSDITVQGMGYNGSRITQSSTTADIFTVGLGVTYRQNIRIEKMALSYSSTPTAGAAINCYKVRSLYVDGVAMISPFRGINLRDVSIAWINGVQMRNLPNATGIGIDIWDGVENEININNLLMDAPSGSQPSRGIRIRQGSVTRINGCDIMHAGIGIEIVPDAGAIVGWVFITDTFSDNSGNGSGAGLLINAQSGTAVDQVNAKGLFCTNGAQDGLRTQGAGTINRLKFVECGFNNNVGRGVRLEGTGTKGPWKFIGCSSMGNFQGLRLITSPASLLVSGGEFSGNSSGGIHIDGIVANTHITDTDCRNNGSHGLSFEAGASDFQVIGNRTTGNSNRGISVATGASDRYIIKHNITHDNTNGNLVDGGSGTNKFVSENITS